MFLKKIPKGVVGPHRRAIRVSLKQYEDCIDGVHIQQFGTSSPVCQNENSPEENEDWLDWKYEETVGCMFSSESDPEDSKKEESLEM